MVLIKLEMRDRIHYSLDKISEKRECENNNVKLNYKNLNGSCEYEDFIHMYGMSFVVWLN